MDKELSAWEKYKESLGESRPWYLLDKENYVEDCIAYFILDVTKTYLIEKAAKEANEQARIDAEAAASDLANWIRSN